jgi:hypothetical protein
MGLTCKQLAQAWGIAVTKVTQAREPTFRKMARAMLMFPQETMEELSKAMDRERSSQSGCCNGVELTPLELSVREDMLCGRIDRERVHPQRKQPRSHEAT